jgi:transporter family protein
VSFHLPISGELAKVEALAAVDGLVLHRAGRKPRCEFPSMSTSTFALLIGGVVPACLWGIAAIFQKLSTHHDLAPGPFLAAFGITITLSGVVFGIIQREPAGPSWAGLRYALAAGFFYAVAAGLISFALLRFGVPISKLAPILGCNVLITVLLGAFLLGEAESLNVGKLVGGTMVVLAGLTLVTTA